MQKNNKRCNKGHKKNKDPNKSDLVHFFTKNRSTTIPTDTNMVSSKIIVIMEANKMVDLVLGNNITFY